MEPTCLSPGRRTGPRLLLLLGLLGWGAPSVQAQVPRNLNATFSEEDGKAPILEASLTAFLKQAEAGEFSQELVDPKNLERYAFFFKAIRGLGPAKGEEHHAPTLMKSYTLDGEVYFMTVAYAGTRDGKPFIYKIVELEARPHGEGYRFNCPFEERTAGLQVSVVKDVTYHHSRPLDMGKAAEFARFRETFSQASQTPRPPIDYYCFRSLDELLTAHGLIFDVARCNFLGHDLGFMDNGGQRFVTGTGNPSYIFEYVGEHLEHHLPASERLYHPFVVGMSAYYGGWALSGEDIETLKAQVREDLGSKPGMDFLQQFRKGRGASVQRHPYFYVLSAVLCQEAVEAKGLDSAMQLALSGPQGESFFANLEAALGVTEANFHDTILRLIDAP